MKKHSFILAACMLFAGLAHAQTDRRGFVGIGVGASIPTADFASTDENNLEAGYAKTGILFDLQMGYKFTEVLGVMGMVRSQANPYDETTGVGEGFTLEADPWATLAFMAGPFVSFPLGPKNKVAFEARLLAGYARTRMGEIILRGMGDRVVFEAEQGGGFAYMIGPGLRFNLTERFGMGVHVDYFSTKPEFTYEVVPGVSTTEKQPIQNVNLSLSLGYRFM